MKTDSNIDNTIKTERRKVFYAMNNLPWILLVVVMGMGFYFYRLTPAPNVTEPIARTMINPIVDDPRTPIVDDPRTELDIEDVTTTVQWNTKVKIIRESAIFEFQVDAVTNGHAVWDINVRGERSFRWKDVAPVSRTIHGITLPQPRHNTFTVGSLALANDINLNIEEEINKIIIYTVESNFIGKTSSEEQELKTKLESELIGLIKRLFDGFEAFNK